MMLNKRRPLLGLAFVFAVVLSAVAADTIPRDITDDAFWHMVSDFSESAGSFRFQFMSNEREFPSALPELKKTAKPDGIYLGVGPEQNFTYIAATTPKLAFIFDIRRENMLEHLIYKSLFELSSSRSDFISRLFSRKAPAGLNDKSTVGALFQAYAAIAPDPQLLRQNLQAIKDRLMKDRHFPLTAEDQASIDNIYRTICEAGPGPAGGGRGGANYAELMMATDEKGVAHSYLAVEENFRFVQDMEKRNRIVPLVGDFAGTKAIRAVAKYLTDHGATVSTFYTSNVEQYLFQQADDWRHYYSNVATLPLDASSTFLRSSHFAYTADAQPRPRQFTGTNYVMLLGSIADLVKAFNEGHIQNYDQVIRMSR
jgi:hypothetical protein